MPSLLYTLGLFVLSRDMQRRGKAVCSKREKEMTWTTQNKMIKLMHAKKKGGSAGKSLIFGLQFIHQLLCMSVKERDTFPKQTQDQSLGRMNTCQFEGRQNFSFSTVILVLVALHFNAFFHESI